MHQINDGNHVPGFSLKNTGFPDTSGFRRISGYIPGSKDIEILQSVFYTCLYLN